MLLFGICIDVMLFGYHFFWPVFVDELQIWYISVIKQNFIFTKNPGHLIISSLIAISSLKALPCAIFAILKAKIFRS